MKRDGYEALTQAIEERMRALMKADPEGSFEVRFKLSQALIELKMWWDEGRGTWALPVNLDDLSALGVVLPPMAQTTDDAAPRRVAAEQEPDGVTLSEMNHDVAEWADWIRDRRQEVKRHQRDLQEKALTDLLRDVRERRKACSQLPGDQAADVDQQLDALAQEVLAARTTVRYMPGIIDTAEQVGCYDEAIAILESLPGEIYVDGLGQEHDRLERLNELRKGQADFLRGEARERLGDAEQSLPAHPDTAAAYLQEGLDSLNKVAPSYRGEAWKELRDELARRQRQVRKLRRYDLEE
jgi:hypothetical protein